MSRRQTKYNSLWEKDHSWLQKCKNDQFLTYFKICKNTFSVSSGGTYLVKQYEKIKTHISRPEELCNQLTFQKGSGSIVELDKSIHSFLRIENYKSRNFAGFEVCRCKLVFSVC